MNWGQLKAAVTSWAARSDLTADPTIYPLLLEMAEQRIFQGSQRRPGLRLRSMLATVDPFTPGTLPTGFLQVERVSLLVGGRRKTLEYRAGDVITDWETITGIPEVYTIRGASLLVAPGATTTVRLDYYVRPALFSADSDTNAVIDAFPSVWLYAMTVEVGNWTRDPEMVAQYLPLLDESIEAAHATDERSKRGLSAPVSIVSQHSVRV